MKTMHMQLCCSLYFGVLHLNVFVLILGEPEKISQKFETTAGAY